VNSAVLDDICTVIGYTPTRYLIAWFSGRQVYVPMTPDLSHPLRSVVGLAAFVSLVREFGGSSLKIPQETHDVQYRRDRHAAERLAAGASIAEVATELDVSVRRAEQIRSDLLDRGWLDFAGGARLRRGGGPKPTPSLGIDFGASATFGDPPPPPDGALSET
jgi:hypothetical protein